jgi:biotin-(acetyl-CoA carboxylase) ligase
MFAIRHLAETGSTNDDAARLLGEPEGAGLVLVSDFQHTGRGRRSRAWVAPGGGAALLFTRNLQCVVSRGALALQGGFFYSGLSSNEQRIYEIGSVCHHVIATNLSEQ